MLSVTRHLTLAAALLAFGCERPVVPTPPAPAPLVDGLFTPSEVRELLKMRPPDAPPSDETNEVAGDPRAALLGQALFFDTGLSKNSKISCATCHQPDHAFSSPLKLGLGLDHTPRHPPTLLNVAYMQWYDWDGKADTLWGQAMRPLENPLEHGVSRTFLAQHLWRTPKLRESYETIFGPLPDVSDLPPEAHPGHPSWLTIPAPTRKAIDRVFVQAMKAIAAYEMKLVRFDTPLDAYLQGLATGDPSALNALSPSAKRGLKTFATKGRCIVCHNGPLLSDMAFHNLGLGPRDWIDDPKDPGRRDGVRMVRANEFGAGGPWSADPKGPRAAWAKHLAPTPEDAGQFRTPTLRNVARTSPYMHAGHFDSLRDVIEFYNRLNEPVGIGHREDALRPVGLDDAEISDLVSLLEAMSSPPLPEDLLHPPHSLTPKP